MQLKGGSRPQPAGAALILAAGLLGGTLLKVDNRCCPAGGLESSEMAFRVGPAE